MNRPSGSRKIKPFVQRRSPYSLYLAIGSIFIFFICGVVLFLSGEQSPVDLRAAPIKLQFLFGSLESLPPPVQIPVNISPGSLANTNVQSLTTLRTKALSSFLTHLISPNYKFQDLLSENISPSTPWLSLYSAVAAPGGSGCGSGVSADYFTIANPLLLVEARFPGLTARNPNFRWRSGLANPQAVTSPDFPAIPRPWFIEFDRLQSKFTISYNLSEYIERLRPWIEATPPVAELSFSLSGLNARDMGFAYMAIDPKGTRGIRWDPAYVSPLQIASKIASSSAGLGASCTAIVDEGGRFSRMQFEALPAELAIPLWSSDQEPSKDPSLMRVVIRFT